MSLTAELLAEIALLQSALAGFMDAQRDRLVAAINTRALGGPRRRDCFSLTIFN
jgi:hypothetical protein